MRAQGHTIIQWLEQLAPKHLAIPDDKIGLQLGSLQKPIDHVLVALDITDEVVDEAIAAGVDLIIAHHAIIYRPLQQLRTDTPAGKLYEKLIKHDIAVYIAHTNLDVAVGGVNDWLAEALELRDTAVLAELSSERLFKLAVFVPPSHADAVRQAMFAAGAGAIGNYTHCSYNIDGFGTFMPQEGTSPFSGEQGKLAQERELKIESVVPEAMSRRVVQAMIKAHPYEEVAYDLYELIQPGESYGIGRVGRLEAQLVLHELVAKVKAAYGVAHVRVVGSLDKPIDKVAIVGGSGSRYMRNALHAGADVLITGDIDYHTAHDALAAGLAIIDAGHNIEKVLKQPLADYLHSKLQAANYSTRVTASQIDTEPFQFV